MMIRLHGPKELDVLHKDLTDAAVESRNRGDTDTALTLMRSALAIRDYKKGFRHPVTGKPGSRSGVWRDGVTTMQLYGLPYLANERLDVYYFGEPE